MQNLKNFVEKCFRLSIKKCSKCFNMGGTIVDKSCAGCCHLFGKKCLKLSEFCSNSFRGPLSFCFFVTLAFSLTPIIFGGIGYGGSQNLQCKYPIDSSVLILTLSHVFNILAVLYIKYKYNNKLSGIEEKLDQSQIMNNNNESKLEELNQKNEVIQEDNQNQGQEEQVNFSVLKNKIRSTVYKVAKLTNLDPILCIYKVYLIFLFIWLIVASAWEGTLPSNDPCRTTANGTVLLNSHIILIIFSWFYLIFGFFIFGLILTLHGFSEGTCTNHEVCKSLALAFTCGQYKMQREGQARMRRKASYIKQRGSIKEKSTVELFQKLEAENLERQEIRKSYKEKRLKYLYKAMTFLNNLGFAGKPEEIKNRKEKGLKTNMQAITVGVKDIETVNNSTFVLESNIPTVLNHTQMTSSINKKSIPLNSLENSTNILTNQGQTPIYQDFIVNVNQQQQQHTPLNELEIEKQFSKEQPSINVPNGSEEKSLQTLKQTNKNKQQILNENQDDKKFQPAPTAAPTTTNTIRNLPEKVEKQGNKTLKKESLSEKENTSKSNGIPKSNSQTKKISMEDFRVTFNTEASNYSIRSRSSSNPSQNIPKIRQFDKIN